MKTRRRREPTLTLTRMIPDGMVGFAQRYATSTDPADRIQARGTVFLIGGDPTADIRIEGAPAWLAEIRLENEATARICPVGNRAVLIDGMTGPRAVVTGLDVPPGTEILTGAPTLPDAAAGSWRITWEF